MGLATLSHSCADCIEILGTSKSWSPRSLSRSVQGKLYQFLNLKPFNIEFTNPFQKRVLRLVFVLKMEENISPKHSQQATGIHNASSHKEQFLSNASINVCLYFHFQTLAYKFYRAGPGGRAV